jgi:hypothetical protein
MKLVHFYLNFPGTARPTALPPRGEKEEDERNDEDNRIPPGLRGEERPRGYYSRATIERRPGG